VTGSEPAARPLLRVVKGDPTPEELAALVAVVAARAAVAGAGAGAADPAPSAWADRAAAVRRPLPVGPGAWARSGRAPGVRTRAAW
jgi:Acyl-CoA carboxylase epsilon subunit